MQFKDYMTVFVPVTLAILVNVGAGMQMFFAMQSDIADNAQDIAEMVDDFKTTRAAYDNREIRQWTRINDVEEDVMLALANERAIQAVLNSVQQDVELLRDDIKENNSLLRQLLTKGVE